MPTEIPKGYSAERSFGDGPLISNAPPCGSFSFSMQPRRWMTCGSRPATGSRSCRATVPGNTASGLTISGVSAFGGATATPTTLRLRITTKCGRREEGFMAARKLSPVHPGEVLQEEFLKPLGISQYRLAKEISVPPRRVNEIVHGNRAITADTALRLARFFGTTDRFWLNLQARYDLEVERDRLGSRLEREVSVLGGSAHAV